jgi:sec-independent protein translocase protein TatA
MFGLGAGEILLIGVIALLFVGPKKIPELAKGFGKAIREFQDAKDEVISKVENEKPHSALENPKKDS